MEKRKYKKPSWLIKAEEELDRAIETGEYDKWLLEQAKKYKNRYKRKK